MKKLKKRKIEMFRVFLCIRMKHHVVVHVEIRLVQVEQDPIVVTGRVAEMEKENEKISKEE